VNCAHTLQQTDQRQRLDRFLMGHFRTNRSQIQNGLLTSKSYGWQTGESKLQATRQRADRNLVPAAKPNSLLRKPFLEIVYEDTINCINKPAGW
jgi:23S rRNA-/tRNA-specific pseudouridylate synthase